jgi:hypothetical protein
MGSNSNGEQNNNNMQYPAFMNQSQAIGAPIYLNDTREAAAFSETIN